MKPVVLAWLAQLITETPVAFERRLQEIQTTFDATLTADVSDRIYVMSNGTVLHHGTAEEITRNGLSGAQTIANIAQRAQDQTIDVRRDDIRFVLDVVSETDPWFEQGASAKLFAGRFRNFVVARCRSQGLNLSADELDLIDAWFAGAPQAQRAAPARPSAPQPQPQPAPAAAEPAADRWWNTAPSPADRFGAPQDDLGSDEFPRIVRRNIR